jgi:hypothetical protein
LVENCRKDLILDCYCWTGFGAKSAGPNNGSLLSVIVGSTTSTQIGFEPITLKKLHSFLVAAEAACSSGDLPVAAVEARLAAVPGLATAAAPTLLAAAVPELLNTARGAAQPLIQISERTEHK